MENYLSFIVHLNECGDCYSCSLYSQAALFKSLSAPYWLDIVGPFSPCLCWCCVWGWPCCLMEALLLSRAWSSACAWFISAQHAAVCSHGLLYSIPSQHLCSVLNSPIPVPCMGHCFLLSIGLDAHPSHSRVGQNKKSEWKGDKYLSTENVKCLHLDDRFLWFFFLFIYSNILTIMYFLVEVKYL